MELFTPEKLAAILVVVIAAVINLFIMYLVLKRFLFRPILNLMAKREQEALGQTQATETALANAATHEEAAKKQINNAVEEAARILHDAKTHANASSESILNDAKRKAKDIVSRAEKERELIKLAALKEARGEIVDLAMSVSTQVIRSQINPETQRQMVDSILDEKLQPRENHFERGWHVGI